VSNWRASRYDGGVPSADAPAKRRPSDDDRIEDLAKGLRDSLEADRSLVGPLVEDYRHLARVLALVLRDLTNE
jgi:hypothetical protein